MALHTGVGASKFLIVIGAGLTGTVVLKSGHLSDLISNLQELISRINEAETSPGKYDAAAIAAQVRQLAKEIKELSLSNPVTILNTNSASGSLASCIFPAAALGVMGYCYMRWKGLSFSDVMFVTKKNMANAVATVSKQLENVSEALALTKNHLTKRIEGLDVKVDEQRELSKLVANDVTEVRCDLSQIGIDIDLIQKMVSGLEGKIDLLESSQDETNSGLLYLCQVASNIQDGGMSKIVKDVGSKIIEQSAAERTKGLQFIIEDKIKATEKTADMNKGACLSGDKTDAPKMTIRRSYAVGLSFSQGIVS